MNKPEKLQQLNVNDRELKNFHCCYFADCPHLSPLPIWERELESGSPSLKLGEGLGEGFAPLREEGEKLDISKSTFLNKSLGQSGSGLFSIVKVNFFGAQNLIVFVSFACN